MRWLMLLLIGSMLNAGCSTTTTTGGGGPAGKFSCDRNGDQEQRKACS